MKSLTPKSTDTLGRFVHRDERMRRERLVIEVALVFIILTLTIVLHESERATFAVLNLFFLPVTLAGFFLGRYRAANTAFFCVLVAAFVLWNRLELAEWMAVSVWGGVLGLQAIVIGTLCDDHQREVNRLHELHRTDTLSDALTGVANRRAFDYELNRRLAEWNRQRVPLTLLLLDIDHFKRLNDSYGHQAGDKVLQKVAETISEICRETDLVARYGGEEFAVVMPNTPASEGMKVAERVRCGIEAERFEIAGLSVKVTVSVGLAQVIRAEESGTLVQRADVALYSSKQAGRNCSHYHDGHQCEGFGAVAMHASVQKSATKETIVAPISEEFREAITGLPARRVFVDELRRRIAEARRYANGFSVMLVQMDDLHEDGMTEEARMTVLGVVAENIRYVMRDSDLVAYFDADQFGVLMPSTRIENAGIPAARLCQRIAQYRGVIGTTATPQITISIGLTGIFDDDTVATVLQRVEEGLWCAVREGGNRVVCVDEDGARAELQSDFVAAQPHA